MTNPSRVTLLQRKRKRKRRSSSSSSQKWIPTIMKKSIFLLLMIVPTFVLIINSMRFNYSNNNGDNKILFDDEDHSNNYEDGGIRNFDSPTVSKDNIRKLSSSLSSSSSSLRSPTIIISTETDNSNTANGATSTINPKDSEVLTDNKVKVFIGIKTAATKYKTTSSKQHHGSQRLPQITSTWLHDVVQKQDQIDLKFFASKLDLDVFARDSEQQKKSTTTTDKSDPPIIDFTSEESINKWFIQTPEGCNQHCCKGEMMFKYYLNKYVNVVNNESDYSTWFCSFDDDNYILIDNLLNVLNEFEESNSTAPDKIYVGRTSLNAIFKQQYMSSKNIRYIQFLTGGAGYCMSKRLMIDGSQIYKEYGNGRKQKLKLKLNGFLNFTKYCDINHLPDDVSVGLWVNTDLNVKQIIHPLFHSHLEINLKKELPVDDIYKQVSFGYDNKIHHGGTNVPDYFPNIPIIAYDDNKDDDDDPMLFKSLRKFIHEQQKQ